MPHDQAFLDELKARGVTTIINLQSGIYQKFHKDFYETADLSYFKVVEIPCSDFCPPRFDQWQKLLSEVYKSKNKTYVHCLHGKDRTGFMCAMYQMRVKKMPYDKAIKEMFDFGFHKSIYLWWLCSLKQFSKYGI